MRGLGRTLGGPRKVPLSGNCLPLSSFDRGSDSHQACLVLIPCSTIPAPDFLAPCVAESRRATPQVTAVFRDRDDGVAVRSRRSLGSRHARLELVTENTNPLRTGARFRAAASSARNGLNLIGHLSSIRFPELPAQVKIAGLSPEGSCAFVMRFAPRLWPARF